MSGTHGELRAAFDPNTPIVQLMRLAQSEDETIRGAVAFATGAPGDVFGMLGAVKGHHVRTCLKQRSFSRNPRLGRPKSVTGRTVRLRSAGMDEAEAIAELRPIDRKAKSVSATPDDGANQFERFGCCQANDGKVYFIIEDLAGKPIGMVRLHDAIGCSFGWDSWLLKDGVAPRCAIESAVLVYRFALSRGFVMAHFDVRRDNTSVWKFHERFGAKRVAKNDAYYSYRITKAAIEASMKRFARFRAIEAAIEY